MKQPRVLSFQKGQRGTALAVRVIPRASKNEISARIEDGWVTIHLTSDEIGEQANAVLVGFLAKILSIPTMEIEIVAGLDKQEKIIAITGMDPLTVQNKILKKKLKP